MKPTVRRATVDDFLSFYSRPSDATVVGYVGEIDGEIIGIGGLALSAGRAMAFFDGKQDMAEFKVTLHKTALRVLDDARALGFRRVYAARSEKYPRAERWLTRLGFQPVDGEAVFVWLN